MVGKVFRTAGWSIAWIDRALLPFICMTPLFPYGEHTIHVAVKVEHKLASYDASTAMLRPRLELVSMCLAIIEEGGLNHKSPAHCTPLDHTHCPHPSKCACYGPDECGRLHEGFK